MLRLNCFFQAKEGRLDDALAAAKELTAASLKQDGCVAYDVFASATRPGVLLICETWRDEAALAAHSASGPFVKNVAIINNCGEMKIEKFESLNSVNSVNTVSKRQQRSAIPTSCVPAACPRPGSSAP